ncbi:MAG: hypothetical protein VYC39_16270 [Myxococcota bacterium]|nr:hypothetical protein [Myxococcota bacterium]
MQLPKPLKARWMPKPLSSAQYWVAGLDDGRTRYCIEHEVLSDVTPAMIVWFLNHMTDRIEVEGELVQQYRLWHPVDHISLTYLKKGVDGRNFGSGAQIRIQEAFQGNPDYMINVLATVEYLDETGFAHYEKFAGMRAAEMRYTFEPTEQGTVYKNSLTVGVAGDSLAARFINRVVAPRVFPKEKGLAWVKHNIEEVGAFETFLPQLYNERKDKDS